MSGTTQEVLERLRENIFKFASSGKTKYEIVVANTWGSCDFLVDLYKEVNTQCEGCIHPDVCKYAQEHQQKTDAVCGYYKQREFPGAPVD